MFPKKRILLIDDDPDFIFLLKAKLKARGYDCISPDTAQEGLKLAQELAPHLILLDLQMPGMSG